MGTAGQIYAALKAQLGTAYTVLEAYDAMEAIDPSGTIALNITEMEPMHHTGCDDWRFSVAVSGFTLADADRDRSIMQAMSEHVMRSIDADALKAENRAYIRAFGDDVTVIDEDYESVIRDVLEKF